jgi:hypothetical protein
MGDQLWLSCCCEWVVRSGGLWKLKCGKGCWLDDKERLKVYIKSSLLQTMNGFWCLFLSEYISQVLLGSSTEPTV